MLTKTAPRRGLLGPDGRAVERFYPAPSFYADFLNQDFRIGQGSYYDKKTFSDLITLTRPTPRWVWGPAGKLVEVPTGEPAYEYDPLTGEPRGLYLNAASVTNLINYSNDLTYGWSIAVNPGSAGTVASARCGNLFGISPDTAGTKLTTSNIDQQTIQYVQFQNTTIGSTPDTDYTVRLLVSAETINQVYASIYSSGTLGDAVASLDSLAWSGSAFTNKTVRKVMDSGPDGLPVFDISFTYNFSSYPGAQSLLILRPMKDGGFAYGSLYVYYVGCTKTPYPAHPIPTNGTAVTVAGDTCSLANLPIDYGTPGAFVMEWLDTGHPYSTENVYVGANNLTQGFIYTNVGGWPDHPNINTYDNLHTLSNINQDLSIIRRSCLAWDATTMKRSDNGQPVIRNTHNGNLGTATAINIMLSSAGYVRKLKYIPSTSILSDAQCIAEAMI